MFDRRQKRLFDLAQGCVDWQTSLCHTIM